MGRKRGNRDIEIFKNDLKDFAGSAASHVPGVGAALGIYDTYKKGERLTRSTPRALKIMRQRVKSRIKRSLR